MNLNKILLLAALVVGLLSMLWFVIAALLEETVPNLLMPENGYIFDYVVVGAGTGGSVLSALLAKHSNASVLLVEAGDRFGLLSKVPLLSTFQQKGINDWAFLSTPQKHSSKGLEEERQCLPRGKGLGGSAQLNYMLHFDGHEGDFDRWSSEFKLKDWDWLAAKPFLEAGNAKPYELFQITNTYSKISASLYEAQQEFMFKPWNFRRAIYNIKNGLRYSVFQRFLQPAFKYRNLRIMTGTLAKCIEFKLKNQKVVVKSLWLGTKDESLRRESVFEVKILRELIISAGAYQTPQLLMTSGLGNQEDLRQIKGLEIPSFMPQLQWVGRNLHDHLNMPLYISIDVEGPTLNQGALLDPFSILNYLTTGGGHLGNFGVMGHIDNYGKMLNDTYGLTFFAAGAIDETALMSISNFKRSQFRALFPRYHNASQEGFVLISACLQPISRGSVNIKYPNMRRNPLINPNYMDEVQDIQCTINAMRTAVEVVTSHSFADLGPHIHWPRIKECSNFGPFERDFRENKPSDRYLECIIRHVGLGSHHPGGTCRMGTNAQNSVVDSQFRVHGIDKLRIIDASVLPTPISGNPNSIIVGMATRGSAMIIKDLLKSKQP